MDPGVVGEVGDADAGFTREQIEDVALTAPFGAGTADAEVVATVALQALIRRRWRVGGADNVVVGDIVGRRRRPTGGKPRQQYERHKPGHGEIMPG